ncbi:MAG TPA: protein kinase [Candidatus Acidoferrum sp.]|nr:protein kinase [Candidatus Acidoferrum sp.]
MKAGFGTGVAPGPGQPTRVTSFVPPTVEVMAGLFPQFEILELLGQGGMGAVYKARQRSLDRLVALKILPPETSGDPGFADRFTREARALARLNHPNIVAVHEFGQVSAPATTPPTAGAPPAVLHYFVMEYVEGLNLRQLEQAGKLSAREALKIIPQICDALQFAHDEGIVHRDIKPENVMLDTKGRVKITDFGLAKILGLEPEGLRLTGAKDVMGTPHYMAPEQIEHPQEVDHRADIYSLGVVFYEMLTGELPVGKFQPPSQKVHVDVRLDEVVLRTLEKEPERRYQQASDVKTRVESIAATPVPPPPMTAPAAPAQPTSDKIILPAFLLAFFFGVFGMHRFYAGKTRTAFLQLGALLACIPLIVSIVILANGSAEPAGLVALGLLLAFLIIGSAIWATVDWIVIVCRGFTDGQGRRITHWLHPRGGMVSSPASPPASGQPGKTVIAAAPAPGRPGGRTWVWPVAGALMVLLGGGVLLFFSCAPLLALEGTRAGSGTNSYIAPQDTAEPAGGTGNGLTAEAPSPGTSPEAAVVARRTVNAGSAASLDKTFAVGSTGKLWIDVDRGGVRLVGGDQDTVQVRVNRNVRRATTAVADAVLADENLVLRQDGSVLSINARDPRRLRHFLVWRWSQPELEASYEITVPRRFELHLKDASGHVKVAQVQGSVTVNTLSGGLEFDDIAGKVVGDSLSGGIHAAKCTDALVLHTLSGGIHVEAFAGPCVQASTASGSVSADFAKAPQADSELHSMSGGITARLPAGSALRLEAHTMSGSVNTDLPLEMHGRVKPGTFRGTINGGGPLLKLDTMSGGINVLRHEGAAS